jgi:hypothetical protein
MPPKEEEQYILANNKFLDRYVKCYACKELFEEEDTEEHEFAPSTWSRFCKFCVITLGLSKGK